MRWIFKTAVSVWLISNTFDIVMAVFDLTQKVVSDSSGIIAGNTRVNDIGLSMLEASLMQMDVGPVRAVFAVLLHRHHHADLEHHYFCHRVRAYDRDLLHGEPCAHPHGDLRQPRAEPHGAELPEMPVCTGFQGFLILICVAIYAVLIQSVAISGDAINSIWSIVGYTVLLCFSLFKTSSVTKSVLGAH